MNGEFKKDGQEWHQQHGTDPSKTIVFERSPKGTYYHKDTPQQVRDILERHMHSSTRLFLDLGDPKTGQSWGDCYNVQGTIGRSMGPVKIPLMIAKRTSTGGPGILDNCIVRIKFTGKHGRELYRHPTYQPPKVEFPQQARLYADVTQS